MVTDDKTLTKTFNEYYINIVGRSSGLKLEKIEFDNSLNETHIEELVLYWIQYSTEIQGWLLLTFFICFYIVISSFNSIILQMYEKRDSSNRQ